MTATTARCRQLVAGRRSRCGRSCPAISAGVRQRRRRRCCRRRRTRASGPSSDPELLAQRQHVRQRLARMLLVGQRIDDVQRAARPRRSREPLLRERADDRRPRPSARDCARRPRASRDRQARHADGGSITSPPSSRTAIVNVDPRPQRRLLEQKRDVLAARAAGASAVRRRGRASARAASVQARDRARRASDRGPTESPAPRSDVRAIGRLRPIARDQPRLGFAASSAHVRYSALMRTYSALKSHVHIVGGVTAAGAEVDRRR